MSEEKAYLITRELNEKEGYTHHHNIVTAHKKGKYQQKPKKGHKIFTNVSTVFKNKRRKGCSGVRRM